MGRYTYNNGDVVEIYNGRTLAVLTTGNVDARPMKSRVRILLASQPWADFNLETGREVGSAKKKAPENDRYIRPAEVVPVTVTIGWGREWTGSYYKETPGKGIYVTVVESTAGLPNDHPKRHYATPKFQGCPCGSVIVEHDDVEKAVAEAIGDYVWRGRPEYRGQRRLEVNMIEVLRTDDSREPERTIDDLAPRKLDDVFG